MFFSYRQGKGELEHLLDLIWFFKSSVRIGSD